MPDPSAPPPVISRTDFATRSAISAPWRSLQGTVSVAELPCSTISIAWLPMTLRATSMHCTLIRSANPAALARSSSPLSTGVMRSNGPPAVRIAPPDRTRV